MRASPLSYSVLPSLILVTCIACVPRTGRRVAPRGTDGKPASTQVKLPTAPLEPPTKGAFFTGRYRNLFEELGYAPADIDAKVAAAYAQLFHGSETHETVMFSAGHNDQGTLAYIMDIGSDDVRSEGMSYGMMIAVQLNQPKDFDALWNWAKSYMYHGDESHPAYGYFSWQMRKDGTAIDEMPAPDGEEYFATSLLFAAHRWGNRTGIFHYENEALRILDHLKNRKSIRGKVKGKAETTCVSLFNTEKRMVRFTPDTGNFAVNGDHTDPSYHVPAFYELWARNASPSDRDFWVEAARVSRDFFVKSAHPKTGLTPDYAEFDGTPKAATWDAGTAQFRFDAFRTAMNWSVDAVWWAKDPRETELSDRLLAFFDSQGKSYRANFTLEGKPTVTYASQGLMSTNAVAALSATHPRAWQFVQALYKMQPPTGKWRYYDGMLYLMSMLHVSGKFRIYAPGAVNP